MMKGEQVSFLSIIASMVIAGASTSAFSLVFLGIQTFLRKRKGQSFCFLDILFGVVFWVGMIVIGMAACLLFGGAIYELAKALS